MTDAKSWEAIAAYLYILNLDDRGLAWECLRRNPDYLAAWEARERSDPEAFGLVAFEDPSRDARDAEPLWDHEPAALTVIPDALPPVDRLQVDQAPEIGFDLWAMPAPRRLLHDGRVMRAAIGEGGRTRVHISGSLRAGRPFAYQIPAGAGAAHRRRQAHAAIAALERRSVATRPTKPQRDAIIGMRTFAAYDADRAGASHRAIALALFGEADVCARWSADSDLRAQVRHLIQRGRRLISGGYRALVERES